MIQLTAGWCAHGVPYGPNWRCSQCAPTPPTNAATYVAPPIDQERLFRTLDRIVVLLEEIAGRRR